MRSPRRRTVLGAVAVLALVGLTLVTAAMRGGRDDPDGPGGTLALRRFLARSGAVVGESATPPDTGTFVLVDDFRDEGEADEILEWVRGGGRLVVASPDSAIVERLRVGFGTGAEATSEPGCAARETAGVRRIAFPDGGGIFRPEAPEVTVCFGPRSGILAVRDFGAGRAIVLQGIDPFTNEYLSRRDNAVLAHRVFDAAPGRRIAFGPPVVPGTVREGRGAWDSLPLAAKAGLVQLALAVVAFALVRARRLGRVPAETPPSPIPAAELVYATATLYRDAGDPGHAAAVSRRGMIERLSRRTGAGARDAATLAAALPETLRERARRVLGGDEPRRDADLLALEREIEQLRRDVEGADR